MTYRPHPAAQAAACSGGAAIDHDETGICNHGITAEEATANATANAATVGITAEAFIPRTERERWQAIADALNAAETAGMPVGIDLDGTLTDHRMWSVVWDRAAERWDVAGYDDEEGEQPSTAAEPKPTPSADVFTEAAVSRSALLAGADVVENLPQDFECDPGRGDAVKVLRRLADHYVTNEQPTGLTWEARTEHAVRLYATTAIERDDARTETAQALAQRNAVFTTNEQLLAQVEEAGQARIQAENAARTLHHRLTAVRTIHTKYDDSEHCRHDAESWPCPTVAALDVFRRTYRAEAGR